MEIFGIKFSKNEGIIFFIFLLFFIIYVSSYSYKIQYNKKIKVEYYCLKKICIEYPYYTKCVEFDKPTVFSFKKIKLNNRVDYIIFETKNKVCTNE